MTEVRKIQKFMLNQTLRRLGKTDTLWLVLPPCQFRGVLKKTKELVIPVKLYYKVKHPLLVTIEINTGEYFQLRINSPSSNYANHTECVCLPAETAPDLDHQDVEVTFAQKV